MFAPSLMLLLSALPVSPDNHPAVDTGAALLAGCEAEMRLLAPGAAEHATPHDLMNGAYCVGYVNGFIANIPDERSKICPVQQPLGALIQAYVGFMQHHPQLLGEDKRLGLRLALEGTFPCPTPGALLRSAPSSPEDRL